VSSLVPCVMPTPASLLMFSAWREVSGTSSKSASCAGSSWAVASSTVRTMNDAIWARFTVPPGL
jgi:hypothetical protein